MLGLATRRDEFEKVGNAALNGGKKGIKVMQERREARLEGHIEGHIFNCEMN